MHCSPCIRVARAAGCSLVLLAALGSVAAAEIVREVLPGGTQVVVIRSPGAPRVWASATWSGGVRAEPTDRPGLARMMAGAWTGGCGPLDGDELARALHRADSTLEGRADMDAVELAAEWPAQGWGGGFDLLAACALRPRFEATAVDRARREVLARRALRADSASLLVEHLLLGSLLAGTPHGRDPLGDPAALEAIDRDVIAAHHRDQYGRGGLALAVVGDVQPDEVVRRARRWFSAAPDARISPPAEPDAVSSARPESRAGASGLPGPPALPGPPGPFGAELFAFLDRQVAEIAIGFPGAALGHPDRAAADLLAAILEERLVRALRARGAHHASARSVSGAVAGALVVRASCRPDAAPRVVAALREEIDRLRQDGPAPGELAAAVRRVRARERAERSSPAARASIVAAAHALGTSLAHGAALARVRASEVTGVAAGVLAWDRAVTATVLPPRASPEAARRMRGTRKRPPARRRGGRR